mgnify:FL=1
MEFLEPTEERLITPEEREKLNKTLGSMGLYNAAMDNYIFVEHPEDDTWILPSIN